MPERRHEDAASGSREGNETPPRRPAPAVDVLRRAGAELAELTGLRPEAVTRVERTDSGWCVEAEVLELSRVPDTMSLMALYEVTTDDQGALTGYRRTRRYERGRADPR
ncbi:gas vesicle protein GvpO [Streptomyces sp. TRM 70351]|uniref:gas vesicle protein GvpO n=1 Tax=Streptomyces sp. TRM 70351 TaxID=3116552 RepID=UPI002E7B6DE9|nr:gas vesicle protein GvpO [Streptomyces sp. TRM 70351]MEE1928267.1 gas vesicle protein GvpO [Streptomyces sp. TRM 70351]